MTTMASVAAVKKQVVVKAGLEQAFNVFTDGFDTWWPRGHHIGKQPLQKAVIEPRPGGRCYGREADGNECQWGTVTTWDPPNRLVIAWQIGPSWQFEPDLAKASEVEVRFTAEARGFTRVDLEHRHFERHGADFEKVRIPVDSAGGWDGLLQMFARRSNVYHPSVAGPAFIFATGDSHVDRTFQGVAESDLWKRPTPQNNPMLWILGHMVNTRARLLAILGENFDTGLNEQFSKGATLQEASVYPSREQILATSREVNKRLYAKLASLTDADLARPATRAFTSAVTTVGDQVTFLAFHDAYHAGQLAYVRKALGLPGLA